MKKIVLLIITVLCIVLCSCSNQKIDTPATDTDSGTTNVDTEASKTDSEAKKADPVPTQKSFYDQLSALDGVISVEKIEQGEKIFEEKYIITFQQPLDWSNPDAGKFNQRVEVGYQGNDHVNVFFCEGYMLYDVFRPDYLGYDDRSELCKLYDGNFINIEYRFFGKSVPEGLSNEKIEYWQYLTSENASADINHIVTQLSSIMSGSSIFSGHSKGGLTVNTLAYFYPDAVDAYVAYVAPLCDGTDDPAFMHFIYEDVGSDGNESELAAQNRELILKFQVELLKNREHLVDDYMGLGLKAGDTFTDFCTKDVLFDVAVLELATQTWQYRQDFSSITRVMNMPNTTNEEINARMEEMLNLLFEGNLPSVWSTNDMYFPYYVQSALELGEHSLDFSWIRSALEKEGLEDCLTVTKDMEKCLLNNMVFTPEQLEVFVYDKSFRDKMIEWSQTTKSDNIFMIYGGTDPWYSVRIPDTDNNHIHRYVVNDKPHSASIKLMSDEDKNNFMTNLNKCLGVD